MITTCAFIATLRSTRKLSILKVKIENVTKSNSRRVTGTGYFNTPLCKQQRSKISTDYRAGGHREHGLSCKGFHRKWYSKWTSDPDKEHYKVKEIFPEPRVTLNVLESRLPQKVFDVYYKHNTAPQKIAKKRAKMPGGVDWTCTYAFHWPEPKTFESTAMSKRQAAEAAATSAVAWLYSTGHVNRQGRPNAEKVEGLREVPREQLVAAVGADSEQRMRSLLEMYEAEIKEIYTATHKAALEEEELGSGSVPLESEHEEELPGDEYPREIQDMETAPESQQPAHPVYGRPLAAPTDEALQRRERQLARTFQYFDESRTPLPVDDYTEELTRAMESSRVVIVAGATGCGKSTRVPLAALRSLGARAAVLVAEPRRVAARGLAARVAEELGEEVGQTVGYQVRLESRLPRPCGGSVLYCTSGVLLRRLQEDPGLHGCTHVMIDEAHERDIDTELALLLLRRALRLNPLLRPIVASATLDTRLLTRYFEGATVLEVPGRAHPVEVVYREELATRLRGLRLKEPGDAPSVVGPRVDCAEVADVIEAIDRTEAEGAILVFLPGWAEISAVRDVLRARYAGSGCHYVLSVHSRLPLSEQSRIWSVAPRGVRKVVLASNVAETSLTVPDVTCVLDTGARRESTSRRGVPSLELAWVSQASAKQRMGRAGRVQPGRCYKMYSRERESTFAEYDVPEILRVPLDKIVLDCKVYAPDEDPAVFLAQLPEPPRAEAVARAVDDLTEIGALHAPSRRLTALGRRAAQLPLPPRLCCALLHAAALRDAGAAGAVTQLAAGLDLFAEPMERREEIRAIKSRYHASSDHVALQRLQQQYEALPAAERDALCERLGLRREALLTVSALSRQARSRLARGGAEVPRAEPAGPLTVAALLSGIDTLLRARTYVTSRGKLRRAHALFTSSGERAHVAAESVQRAAAPGRLLLYAGGVRSPERRSLGVRHATAVTPRAVLLCARAARALRTQIDENGNEWSLITLPRHNITVHVPARQADVLLAMRNVLWETFQYFIERDHRVEDENHTKVQQFREDLVSIIVELFEEDERELNSENSK